VHEGPCDAHYEQETKGRKSAAYLGNGSLGSPPQEGCLSSSEENFLLTNGVTGSEALLPPCSIKDFRKLLPRS